MKNKIKESTTTTSSGRYKVPIVLAPQLWKKKELGPFTEPLYSFDNAELAYQEADGDFKQSEEETVEIEKKTDRVSKIDRFLKQFYTVQNDDSGSNLAQIDSPERLINRAIRPEQEEDFLKEDLAVWFGKKKKPKGSSQPKGPWVNICRKDENGKHPPCGRENSDKGAYPKCRAVHVASKMSDSEKKSACQQKRKVENKNSKSGKGNKPTMVSYKPQKESIRDLIKKILKEEFN